MVKVLQDSTVEEEGTTKSVVLRCTIHTIMTTNLCTEIQEPVIGFNSFINTTTTVHFLS